MDPLGYNSGYVEDLYAQYLQNPDSVSESWREFFADFDPGARGSVPQRSAASGETATPSAAPAPEAPAANGSASSDGAASGDGAPAASAPAAPAAPASQAPAPQAPAALACPQIDLPEGAETSALRGVAARIVDNMEASLTIPTATSVREVPVKLMAENRRLINRRQMATGGDKVSYTHLIAYAMVKAMEAVPAMREAFRHTDKDGERITPEAISLGLAIDIEKRGKRQLLVPNIKKAESLTFAEFLHQYNDIVKRARDSKLELADFQHTSATLTNPGGLGTVMSVPRLMPGQGLIVAVGSIGYPAHYAGMKAAELSRLGLSPVMTITSTYDHRIIQGAESGEFLARMAGLLTGGWGFYQDVFASLGIH
ncbi:MAG: 2-oxo acid dehydrogenase subunit E2, partial [Bacteroidota bacterium]